MGEEELLPVVDDADAELGAPLTGDRDIGHGVLRTEVVVAELAEQTTLAALGVAVVRREELVDHATQRDEARADLAVVGGSPC